eukprot:scaffold3105_cov213-Skeletonema_menzelii.AAC.5
MRVSYLPDAVGTTDDAGVVKAWLLGSDSASASAVIDSFMVYCFYFDEARQKAAQNPKSCPATSSDDEPAAKPHK